MPQTLTITKAYTRNDVEPVLQINIGDLAIEEEDGWWKITDPEGNKKARVKELLVKELTKEEEEYRFSPDDIRTGNKALYGRAKAPATIQSPAMWVHLDISAEEVSIEDLHAIQITPEILTKISLTYPELDEKTRTYSPVTVKFVENKISLPKNNELEYDPENRMFMLNGLFLPVSPKYLHQLQNCIFGLTFIDIKIDL